MVRTLMSSENSVAGEPDAFCKAKEKVSVQKSLINSNARNLKRLKESTTRLSSNSPNLNGGTPSGSCASDSEAPSALDDDIRLQEKKLMKGFSNQLIEKHRFLKRLEESSKSREEIEKAKSEFDGLISLEQFLNVAGLESSLIESLLEDEALTLDGVFQMQSSELDELVLKFNLGSLERKLLYCALDHLSTFYEALERGEKLSMTNLTRLRCTSTSRLNSISNISSYETSPPLDLRLDSAAGAASGGYGSGPSHGARHSPLPLYLPSSSSMTVTSSPTPVTPSSTNSLLLSPSPSSPFSTGLTTSTPLSEIYMAAAPPPPTSTSYAVPILTPPPLSPGPAVQALPSLASQQQQQQAALIRCHSSSSSVLLGEHAQNGGSSRLARTHHSVSSLSNNGSRINGSHSTVSGPTAAASSPVAQPVQGQRDYSPSGRPKERKSSLKRRRPVTHKRSLSNPLANILLNHHNDIPDASRGTRADGGNKALLQSNSSQSHAYTHGSGSSSATPSSTRAASHSRYEYRSPSPPLRAGSHPFIHCNNVCGSPQPQTKTSSSHYAHHPHMKKIAAVTPGFSQSLTADLMTSSSGSLETSFLLRQNTWQSTTTWQPTSQGEGESTNFSDFAPQESSLGTPRCNSMVGMTRPRSTATASAAATAHDEPLLTDLTSSSMVDLPVGDYHGSTEHLSQDEDCNLPNSSGKSRSVPRLTFMAVNSEGERGYPPSASTPTSPSTPGNSGPAVLMRHKITHRFVPKTYITPHICTICKKKVRIGVRCKDCKYVCHKNCSSQAPPSCGLPKELMNFFRKHVALASSTERLAEQRVEPQSATERGSFRPPMERSSTYDMDTREQFYIPDLTSEPTTTHYSPVMNAYRPRAETVNGMSRHHLSSQSSSTSLLEVPHSHSNRVFHSTSSTPSPSTSPPTSPSLTPSSPRSPNDCMPPMAYPPYHLPHHHHHQRYSSHLNHRRTGVTKAPVFIKRGDESGDDLYEDEYSSDASSTNDISDQARTSGDVPRGSRPPPQVIQAKSLPDLLMLSPTEKELDMSCARLLEQTPVMDHLMADPPPFVTSLVGVGGGGVRKHKLANRRISLDDHGHHANSIKRKESLQRTVSAADSKASTLVASIQDENDSGSYTGSQDLLPEDEIQEEQEEDDEEEEEEEFGDLSDERRPGRSLQHRNSVVDEWNIPFENIKLLECLGAGHMSKVHRGNWHGDIAIKHFRVPNAPNEQVAKFKEEVSVLKRTRHENLALFMGASLAPPNLAIITIYCKGHTLYRSLHVWSEPFNMEKTVNIAKQVAMAMGYLHARRIVHKNLNTRNIFMEKDKVVITDTGLSSFSESFYINELGFLVMKRNKLCYSAPELIRSLSHYQMDENTSHVKCLHTDETDIYAFGTVLYELVLRKFPFHSDPYGFSFPPQVLIYMIGQGKKQEVQARDMPKRMQELLYDCWHVNPARRLTFKVIHEAFIKMSRKKTPIVRSPSFPISLSKSTEGLNFLNV